MSTYFKRLAESQVFDFINNKSNHRNVGLLMGARQVGKTTLLKQILKNRPHLYLNLERHPSIAEAIDRCEDFGDFGDYLQDAYGFEPQQKILVIDEAQVSRRLGSFVRFMKEEWKDATVILTGSVLAELYQETPRRPVGRETFLSMWPLNFKEFLMALDQDSLVKAMETYQLGQDLSSFKHESLMDFFEKYLKVGGLPEVVAYYKSGKDYQKLRQDLFKSYEDDFVRYFSLEEVNLFKRSLNAVAANVGSPSKDTQVVALDRPGYKKVAGILARLEKWKLIIKCEQLGVKAEKLNFYPKRYLYDVGILTSLRLKGLQTLGLKQLEVPALRVALGGVIENALATSLKVAFKDSLFGIRLSSRAEIDFAIKQESFVYPIEVKLSQRFKGQFLNTLRTYLSEYSLGGRGFLLYGGKTLKEPQHGVYVLPFYLADELERLIKSHLIQSE